MEITLGEFPPMEITPMLSWWKESVPEEEESDSVTLAESQE